MFDDRSGMTLVSSSRSARRWISIVLVAAFAGSAAAAPGDNVTVVRNLAGRVGPIIGSALACRDIARPRVRVIVNNFQAVINQAASNDAERDDLSRLLDRYVAGSLASGRIDCREAERQLSNLEQNFTGSASQPSTSLSGVIAPSSAAAAPAPTAPNAPAPVSSSAGGLADNE